MTVDTDEPSAPSARVRSCAWQLAWRRLASATGKAEVLMLRDAGLTGKTHIPFADLNNVEVADLFSKFLSANGLDAHSR